LTGAGEKKWQGGFCPSPRTVADGKPESSRSPIPLYIALVVLLFLFDNGQHHAFSHPRPLLLIDHHAVTAKAALVGWVGGTNGRKKKLERKKLEKEERRKKKKKKKGKKRGKKKKWRDKRGEKRKEKETRRKNGADVWVCQFWLHIKNAAGGPPRG